MNIIYSCTRLHSTGMLFPSSKRTIKSFRNSSYRSWQWKPTAEIKHLVLEMKRNFCSLLHLDFCSFQFFARLENCPSLHGWFHLKIVLNPIWQLMSFCGLLCRVGPTWSKALRITKKSATTGNCGFISVTDEGPGKAQELQVCHDPATKARPNSAIRLLLFAQRRPLTSLKGVRMKCCSGHLNLQSAILRLAWFRQTPPRTANLSFHAVAVVSHKYLPGTAKPQES